MTLYIFIILLLMQFIHTVDGTIYAYPPRHHPPNVTEEMFHDRQAEFGQNIPRVGLIGKLVLSKPLNACSPVQPPPSTNRMYQSYFLLVEEAYPGIHCRYTEQAYNAQRAFYDAVIIFRHDFVDKLVLMGGEGPTIPSVYVKREAGLHLQRYLYETQSNIRIEPDPQLPLQLYLIPFAVVVGVCFFFMVIFSVARYARFRLRERRARLTPANLKKIPTKKFVKGDEYDMCAICIEEYEEGDKIRLLPCNHAYHCKCVDPWLTSGKKVCPVCKQSVEIPKQKKKKQKRKETLDGASTSSHPPTATEDETEDDDGTFSETDNERTPLLTAEHDRESRDGSVRSNTIDV